MRTLTSVYLKESNSLEEYQEIVHEIFINWIQNKNPILLLLSGPMGAGKTEFVKTISHKLGVRDVSSPTFAIHQNYQSSQHQIQHVDLYRLETEDEVESSGFWDLFAENDGMIVVEWPERVSMDHFPLNWPLIHIQIEILDSEKRRIQVFK